MNVPVIALREVVFSYRLGSGKMFGGLTHEFGAGKMTVVTGPSGCGKSTLLYLLGLLLTPTAGWVELGGRPMSKVSDSERAALRAGRIGFVFQDAELDPARTVLDSVLEPTLYNGAGRKASLAAAGGLLRRFGLAERAEHRPGEVSGGQAQRIALCRALVNDPEIILADEPTGNLDRDNAALVLDALTEAAHQTGRTVVVATHDPYVLGRADEAVAL
jgi:putative ABC transport system ATP-binding protein/lipoprotein-releasing system ATP-binding protein